MSQYEVVFYATHRGEAHFQTFLDSMTDKLRVKVMKLIDLLEEHGPNLKRPYADTLRDGIRELRCQQGHKVPPSEIERSISYKRDFEERYNREEIE